jgi:hypothetical protein
MKKNKMMICGKNTSTLPTPANTPLMSKSLTRLFGIAALSQLPTAATPSLIASMGTCAHANTAWNTKNKITARITGPKIGFSTTASRRSLKVTPSSRSPPTAPKMRRTSA